MKKNQALIQEATKDYSLIQKRTLYAINQKTAGGPFVLNLLLGYGIGSFAQGDLLGGFTGLGGDVVTSTIMLTSIVLMNSNNNGNKINDTAVATFTFGYIANLGIKVFECIRPWVYAHSYNETLAQSLGISGISYSAVPLYNIETGNMDFSIAMKLDL